MQLILWLCLAHAADVIWLVDSEADDREAINAAAGGRVIAPLALRTAATDSSVEDQQALDQLRAVLEASRAYETQLDGELVIMQDLQTPIASIDILQSVEDTDLLYGALAYQGFAVDRYFGDDLMADDKAADFRAEINDMVVERPWLDAIALIPDVAVTPYQIAEAPQRIAYEQVRDDLSSIIPASLIPGEWPDGADLMLDGEPYLLEGATNIKVRPGRHLAHLELQGYVLQRWDVRLEPGQQAKLDLTLDDDTWSSFLSSLKEEGPVVVPTEVQPHIDAYGEVWVVTGIDNKGADLVKLTPQGGSRARQELRQATDRDADAAVGFSVAADLNGGWVWSGNFYSDNLDQDPPFDASSVNAASVGLGLHADVRYGLLRAGIGHQSMGTLGAHATAGTGPNETRYRGYLHAAVGVTWAQLTAGYAFPHHPTIGAQGILPLPGGFEARAYGLLGFPGTVARGDDPEWQRFALRAAGAGIGWRLDL